MSPSALPLCIYHHNCADGFTGAWVVRRAFDGQVEFHPGVYGEAPPDVTGRRVILVDFSYRREVLLAMAEQAEHITVLDHHKSAQADLEGLSHPKVAAIFDLDRSGARIAWDHYFPDQAPPPLLPRVEDRDLWRFALPGTRQIQAALFSYPYDFKLWDELMLRSDLVSLFNDGQAIERKHMKDIAELLKMTARLMEIGGHIVPVANLPYTMASDAAGQMAVGMLFAATYFDTDTERVFSLRSDADGLDVSEVAKQYGGGGHKHAAGFRVSRQDAWKMELYPNAMFTGPGASPYRDKRLAAMHMALSMDKGPLTNVAILLVRPAALTTDQSGEHPGELFLEVTVTREEMREMLTILEDDWADHLKYCQAGEQPEYRPGDVRFPHGSLGEEVACN